MPAKKRVSAANSLEMFGFQPAKKPVGLYHIIFERLLKGPILPYDFRAKVVIFQSIMSTGPSIGIRNEKGLPEDVWLMMRRCSSQAGSS
jgi:hypothetical protein